MVATRSTPTSTNGGSDNGISYTNAVNAAVSALFQCSYNWLTDVGGSANAITAASDAALVEPIAAYARPMAFWLVPAVTNGPGGVNINIDAAGVVDLTDKDGNPLAEGALVAGRVLPIVYDGARFRLNAEAGSGLSPVLNINGGRLCLQAGKPVLGVAVTGATAVRWEPDSSAEISLFSAGEWQLVSASAATLNFTDVQTGTTHNGTKIIDGMADTSRLMIGMKLSGTGVGSGAVIQSIDSPTQITSSVNSTAGAAVTITSKVPADTAVDIFGTISAGTLALRGIFRATFNVPNVLGRQDGVEVLDADHTLRWLGAVASSATDGQIDWALNGRRRYRVWNRSNVRFYRNTEGFSASGTWYKPLGLVEATIDVAAAGATSTVSGGASSFGSHASATGGNFGGTNGTGSGGDVNIGGGGGGDVAAGKGGRAIRTRSAADLNATETVTIGSASGSAVWGWVLVNELLEG
ncbi:hypothetical protein [Bradyrhizobium sp. G127]|uniref:hypothetical protein n=1 Tax=Bradyrhizobium sp. G127 TaxID=2904800 RepID=UPI001F265D1A|nr:hypothetical protein [Bradyrhizobium sp. G127]MCF2522353.1 hypothetical protein [Bradyrhizobium sp. G127]